MSSVLAYPNTCATVTYGGYPWSDPNNVKSSNDVYAIATPAKNSDSDWLRVTNFDFSSIPSGATIDGIEVKIEHRGTAVAPDGYNQDSTLQLRKTSGQTGSNKASFLPWGTTDETFTYGGESDKWGATLVDTDIRSSDFGLDLSVAGMLEDGETAYVDVISIRVYYTAAVTFQPFRNYYPHLLAH
jgi:hypothetical protein